MALVPDRSGTDNLSQIELVFAWNFNLSALQKIAANAGAMSLLHGMSNMKSSPTRSFVHLLNGARKSRITVGLASITLGLVGFAQAATDFCQKTAQDALQGCQDSAQSAKAVALGKCENISDPPPHFTTVRQGLKAMGLDASTTTLINAREEDVVEIQVTPRQ